METESEEYDIFDLIIADSLLETHSRCFWERVILSVFRSIYGTVIKGRLKLIENKHYKDISTFTQIRWLSLLLLNVPNWLAFLWNFGGHITFLWGHWYNLNIEGPLVPMFWTSGDVWFGFLSQDGFPELCVSSPACHLIHLWCDTCWRLERAEPSIILIITLNSEFLIRFLSSV